MWKLVSLTKLKTSKRKAPQSMISFNFSFWSILFTALQVISALSTTGLTMTRLFHEYPCSPLARPPSLIGDETQQHSESMKTWIASKNFCDAIGYKLPTKAEFVEFCQEEGHNSGPSKWAAVADHPNAWVQVHNDGTCSGNLRGKSCIHYDQEAWDDLVMARTHAYTIYCVEDVPDHGSKDFSTAET